MNSGQESKNSMYLASKDYMAANAAILTPLPNYSGLSTAFLGYITQIQTYGEKQQFDQKGVAENKSQYRKTLVLLAADTSRKITAYAKFANNQVLLSEIKYTESDLNRIADTSLRDAAQGIYDRAQSNLTALATYGVTAATQTSLQNAINSFVTSIPKPRLSIADKKQTTTQLANLFKQADATLDSIDTLVEIVRLSQPNFYKGYKAARKIVETGNGSLAVKGLVTDATSGEGLKGVSLSFVLDGNGTKAKTAKVAEPIIKKTADKGGFNIKSLPAGMYTVTITKTGYVDQIVSIAVSDGDLTELNIQLSKN